MGHRQMILPKLGVDCRLEKRYAQLVAEHLAAGKTVAAGPAILPGQAKDFACTQALWRFLGNKRVSQRTLVGPLIELVKDYIAKEDPAFLLVVHDWSELHYRKHHGKKDRVALNNSPYNTGYELLTSLVLSAVDGSPVAPVAQALEAADGVHATYTSSVRPARSHLDALASPINAVERTFAEPRCVHIIDAEADAVCYLRRWVAKKRLFLVRADWNRVVTHRGEERNLRDIAQRLADEGKLRDVREVLYHGRAARQWVGETAVVLTRAGYRQHPKYEKGPRTRIPGKPLSLRLVVSRILDDAGNVLAEWYLLTNVPAAVADKTIALWYYWRWAVESYFKLLKSAGLQLEQWEQTSAERIARRLLVAGMACAVVWKLARDTSPLAVDAREILVHLSGRLMKHGRPFTEPALLAGLWILLAILDTLEQYDLRVLKRVARFAGPEIHHPAHVPRQMCRD
jgi:hypothetical protein